jgi:tetratricopeptide (TPR) repeat protein
MRGENAGMALLPAVFSRTVMAWSLAEQGRFPEGLGVAEEGLRVAERAGHPHSVVFALQGIGTVHLRRGDFAEAIRALERARAVCDAAELPAVFLEVAFLLGSAYAQAGRGSDAVELLDRAVAQAMALRHRLGHWLRTGAMAEAYLAAGRAEEALPLAGLFVEITGMMNARGAQGWAEHLLGEVAAHVGPQALDQSERTLSSALASAESLGMPPLAARCRLSLGGLYQRMGKREEARAEFTTAAALCREAGMGYWLTRAELALSQIS